MAERIGDNIRDWIDKAIAREVMRERGGIAALKEFERYIKGLSGPDATNAQIFEHSGRDGNVIFGIRFNYEAKVLQTPDRVFLSARSKGVGLLSMGDRRAYLSVVHTKDLNGGEDWRSADFNEGFRRLTRGMQLGEQLILAHQLGLAEPVTDYRHGGRVVDIGTRQRAFVPTV